MTDGKDASNHVTLSRNETESLCMKAARGAGFSWGMAEEAGFATGWLAAQGIDGAAALLTLLSGAAGLSLRTGAPRPTPGHWQSQDGRPLCPIHLGAALTDHALLADGPFSRETRFDPVQTPILLLPFLVRAACIRPTSLAVHWQGDSLKITRDGDYDRGPAVAWTDVQVLTMNITPSVESGLEIVPTEPLHLPSILAATLNGLDRLALRTTVPATQASRSGAGSSSADDD